MNKPSKDFFDKNCPAYNPYVMMERRFRLNGRILRSDVNQYGEAVENIFLNKIMIGADYQAEIPELIYKDDKGILKIIID
jgi:hypothetical protein